MDKCDQQNIAFLHYRRIKRCLARTAKEPARSANIVALGRNLRRSDRFWDLPSRCLRIRALTGREHRSYPCNRCVVLLEDISAAGAVYSRDSNSEDSDTGPQVQELAQ
ncbi:hypothetical protein BGZ61DRAFT_484864 [Ilyonectria robusta]|uniref:uncharacterized protein n=1 Tax=Ilyonectria robusta TaxID=1079257 RepID=UPI001E8E3D59|nr:uncharacterized protein BGZ61DRAFT_484864 [Ilyonectria robusta]KAH8663803.1 hypothetical protein BGZ61DRAFT_484864 [Ilyonectria robusta]